MRSEQGGCWTYQGEGETRDAARTQTPTCREGLPHPQRQPAKRSQDAEQKHLRPLKLRKEANKCINAYVACAVLATLKRWGTVAAPRN